MLILKLLKRFTQGAWPHEVFYVWIQRLATRGIMSGYPCGGAGEPCDPQNRPYFRWGFNVTRGQASKIVAENFFPGCMTPFTPQNGEVVNQ